MERKFHGDAHIAFSRLARLTECAENIFAKQGPGHYDAPEVRRCRRLLFQAQIVDANEILQAASEGDDAMSCDMICTDRFSDLAAGIHYYLGYSWTYSHDPDRTLKYLQGMK